MLVTVALTEECFSMRHISSIITHRSVLFPSRLPVLHLTTATLGLYTGSLLLPRRRYEVV